MTPAQQALFLASLQEQAWQAEETDAAPPPAITADAGFTLKSERFVRVIEPHGGGFTFRTEPVGAAPSPAPAAASPAGVTRHPVMSLTFQFRYSPEVQPSVSLEVASPP